MANVKDGATSLVATAPSPATSGTSLVVTSGEGALFPTPPFYAILHPASQLPKQSISEKVLVTAISTDTFTIVRAQGSYSAKSVAVGWRISNAIFQEDLNNSSIIQNEVPGGSVNGSNTAFTLASATGMVTGSLRVYKNGIRLKGGGNDFTETSTGFTMTTAPATGTPLLADYNVNGAINNVGTNSLITDEVPSGSVNSSNTTFTTARAYIAGSLEVFVNGVKQARTTHFTETTPSSGTFTMSDAPATGDNIIVCYQFNLNPASNSDTVDGIHASSTATANQLMALDSSAKFSSTIVSSPARVRVQRGTAQSIPHNTWTKVQLNTEVYDTGNNFDSTTNYRFTAPVTGDYFIRGTLFMAGALMQTAIDFYVNGVSLGVIYQDNRQQTTNSPQWVDMIYLTAGDYVEMYIWHFFGSAASLVGASATFRYLNAG